MIITDGEKTITLQELARVICNCIADCGTCPAQGHCYHGHNGMADWLREVIKNEQD